MILLSCLLLLSCKDFLEVQPRNAKIVSTVEDYRDILASYMHKLKSVNPYQEKVMGNVFNFPEFDVTYIVATYTGEISLSKSSSIYYDSKTGEWTEAAMKKYTWLYTSNKPWDHYYQFLGPINMILEGIRDADGEDEDMRNYVRGEALIWRAFAYYKLLQYYAPYKDDRYGVPVYLKPYDDPARAMPERKTQREVFARILEDCNEVMELLEVTPSQTWNCAYRSDFLNAMLADIYAWKAMSAAAEDGDWQKCSEYAAVAMAGRKLTDDPTVFKSFFNCNPNKDGLKVFNHDEFHLRLIDGSNANLLSFGSSYYNGGSILQNVCDGLANPEFYKKYRTDDIRREVYFYEKSDGIYYNKYNFMGMGGWISKGDGGALMPFRLADMYLLKAEALMRMNREGDAKAVLEEFKGHRYSDVAASYTESNLLDEILKERKLEFYQENDCWWLDMKRLGIQMEREVNGVTYVLAPDDFRYCFPIPSSELENNINMVQTPGWENVFIN